MFHTLIKSIVNTAIYYFCSVCYEFSLKISSGLFNLQSRMLMTKNRRNTINSSYSKKVYPNKKLNKYIICIHKNCENISFVVIFILPNLIMFISGQMAELLILIQKRIYLINGI